MPNQSDPTQNQPNPVTPPVISPQVDLPPLPPDFQNVDTSPPAATPPGSPAPPPDIPPVMTTPKKKFGGGRIIATILGFLVLVVYKQYCPPFQQQDIREKADNTVCIQNCVNAGVPPTVCEQQCAAGQCIPNCSGKQCGNNGCGGSCGSCGANSTCDDNRCVPNNPPPATVCTPGDTKAEDCTTPSGCANGSRQVRCKPNGQWGTPNDPDGAYVTQCVSKAGLCSDSCNPNTQTWDPSQNRCVDATSACPQNNCYTTFDHATGGACVNDEYCYTEVQDRICSKPAGKTCNECGWNGASSAEDTISPAGPKCIIDFIENRLCEPKDCSGGGTPPPSGPTAQCQNVKAYSTTWSPLSAVQLSGLKATDQVNFCVAGVTTQGTFDKARFTINGALQAETTTKRPSSNDFCQLYTIPAATTSFSVTAQIHHATLGWK